ncbi:MAG: preprotein translocase subunit SecG [Flavobacteriales bacterium]|nr:preprotein translocase subunit SecG [Flavobacteriales bacterium]MCC6938389.1 preprotein translocase subunit SecG [Flavobacteriales bacterium]
MVALTILILIICALLALVVLAQNPKGGGLASGFTGASQIGGVQRTADFLEKGTWTLSTLLMVLCLVSAGIQKHSGGELNELDSTVAPADADTNATPDAGGTTTDGQAVPPEEGQ